MNSKSSVKARGAALKDEPNYVSDLFFRTAHIIQVSPIPPRFANELRRCADGTHCRVVDHAFLRMVHLDCNPHVKTYILCHSLLVIRRAMLESAQSNTLPRCVSSRPKVSPKATFSSTLFHSVFHRQRKIPTSSCTIVGCHDYTKERSSEKRGRLCYV